MASNPGILTDWPWKPLGNFKYIVLAPWVIQGIYSYIVKDENEKDFFNFMIFPLLVWRVIHNQIWISLSRFRSAKGTTRIVDKAIEFDQVDRESNWDDQIIFNGILVYVFSKMVMGGSHIPLWRLDGIIITFLLHAGPVEFLYYWLHRALHHHYLYSRYHSHHHSSIVTEPITSVIHPFAEHIAYSTLFAIPLFTIMLTGTVSFSALFFYITYIDLMNNLGHCNFEVIPNWLFSIFPPLKYFMYTPSFHSLHHTQFRTNYSLFMPIYDLIYGTMDKSSDILYETSLKKGEEKPDIVHLTHLTTLDSIYHLRLGFASIAANPHSSSNRYIWLMWPVTFCSMLITWIYGRTFVLERNRFNDVKLQTWVIPKYNFQYFLHWQKELINSLIEAAIEAAEQKGAKVISLGLLNQGEELNRFGEIYVERHLDLKIKVVDGSSLAIVVVVNSLPKETTQVILRGNLTKVAYAIAFALCQRGIQVVTLHQSEYQKLKKSFVGKFESNLHISSTYSQKIWLVGDGLTKEEQLKATKGTLFILFSQFPLTELRRDCFYHLTPAMSTPLALENVDSCENWLPRRVMSAWRIGGIIHGLEGWEEEECGHKISNYDKVWEASLRHGFQPLTIPNQFYYHLH
ncbi:very-long-chain aldehyde decarbonylase CER1-like [Mangifera indica]|uniref:very-long-chain aldehyde decarbonylase CER1-like n=1 Tax=Mangifera indica TaxID=29780 RepID=UPI001CFAF2A9|nr:very-long-chain aldehyde decarbonylase CER1-like [Mangifera indica]